MDIHIHGKPVNKRIRAPINDKFDTSTGKYEIWQLPICGGLIARLEVVCWSAKRARRTASETRP